MPIPKIYNDGAHSATAKKIPNLLNTHTDCANNVRITRDDNDVDEANKLFYLLFFLSKQWNIESRDGNNRPAIHDGEYLYEIIIIVLVRAHVRIFSSPSHYPCIYFLCLGVSL